MIKRWQLASFDRQQALQLAKETGTPPLLAALLCARGCSAPQDIHNALDEGTLSDPFLMKDMDKAVERLQRAMDQRERVVIYGDYDADGVTSTAMLYTFLADKGLPVSYYIPQRLGEGYGLNKAALDTLSREGADLIVTVDNGISAVEEIAYANSLGMDVVVTDHHQPQESLPPAVAVVDPHRADDQSPYKDLCGAGVALKLLMALTDGWKQFYRVAPYCDLAAVGTVGDSVPLTGENRRIVLRGLKQMGIMARPGLAEILELGRGERPDSAKLAFTAVPCINATGRMGSPDRAVRLLTHRYYEEAQILARELKADNARRKEVEQDILRAAVKKVEADPALRYARVIVVEGEDWHLGVVGIVAAKLVERFGKPCFVLSCLEDGSCRGSGRSVEGFDMFQAVHSCRKLLTRYGGHPMAAGVTLNQEDLERFRERLNDRARELHSIMPALTLQLDCALKPGAVTAQTVQGLQPLEPCGMGNPQPLFGIMGAVLRGVQPLGSNNAHCRLLCEVDGSPVECVYFRMSPGDFPYRPGTVLDLAVNLQLNSYPRGKGFDFLVRDVKPSALDVEAGIAGEALYEKHRRGEPLEEEDLEKLAPGREQFAQLYRLLSRPGPWPVEEPLALLAQLDGFGAEYGKLLVGLDVLEERGLICREGRYWRVLPHPQKVDLTASPCIPGQRPKEGESYETRTQTQ